MLPSPSLPSLPSPPSIISRVELSSRLRSLLLDDSLLSTSPSLLDAGLSLALQGLTVLKVGRSGRTQSFDGENLRRTIF